MASPPSSAAAFGTGGAANLADGDNIMGEPERVRGYVLVEDVRLLVEIAAGEEAVAGPALPIDSIEFGPFDEDDEPLAVVDGSGSTPGDNLLSYTVYADPNKVHPVHGHPLVLYVEPLLMPATCATRTTAELHGLYDIPEFLREFALYDPPGLRNLPGSAGGNFTPEQIADFKKLVRCAALDLGRKLSRGDFKAIGDALHRRYCHLGNQYKKRGYNALDSYVNKTLHWHEFKVIYDAVLPAGY